MPISSAARRHAEVNATMPRQYWDYDNVEIQWGSPVNYEVFQKTYIGAPGLNIRLLKK
jgi:casein kinase II subunit alpha